MEVTIYRDSLCKLCYEYAENLKFWCDLYDFTYKEVYLEKNVLDIIEALWKVRGKGYYIQYLPMTVVTNTNISPPEILDAWDGFPDLEEIRHLLSFNILT